MDNVHDDDSSEVDFSPEPTEIDENYLQSNIETNQDLRGYLETTRLYGKEINLLEKLDASDIKDLKRYFFPPDTNYGRIIYEIGLHEHSTYGIPLKRDQFITAINDIIGSPEYAIAAAKLFDYLNEKKILRNNVIWWEQLIDAIIQEERKEEEPPTEEIATFKEKNKTPVTHCKSKIVKVLLPETPHSSCYIVVSKRGKVGIYDDSMELAESYFVPLGQYHSIHLSWVTDACYASDSSSIFICSSNRRLFIYNISQIVNKLLFIIEGIPNSPTCLHYRPLTVEKKSILLIGDDIGNIISMIFQQPQKSFFKQKHLKKEESYLWIEILNQKDWVKIKIDKSVHKDNVLELEYFTDNETIVSCSCDPFASLVIREKQGKRAPYIIQLEQGIRYFHLDKKLSLLATTSMDYVIRLWNPFITKKPIKILEGHKERVIDTRILKHIQSVLSISTEGVLKQWSLETHKCIDTINLSFSHNDASDTFSRSIYPGLRQLPQSVSMAYSSFQALHSQANLDMDPTESLVDNPKDYWMRAELVITYFNQVKIISLESKISLEFIPLPMPRRQLEPALPTPYYPLTNTFRENTKIMKQRMFKNLAGLAPFYDVETAATSFNYKCMQDIKEMKTLVRHGVPHFGLELSKIKQLNQPSHKKEKGKYSVY